MTNTLTGSDELVLVRTAEAAVRFVEQMQKYKKIVPAKEEEKVFELGPSFGFSVPGGIKEAFLNLKASVSQFKDTNGTFRSNVMTAREMWERGTK